MNLVLFDQFEDSSGQVVEMESDNQRFHLKLSREVAGQYYGYQVYNRNSNTQEFPPFTIIPDPYSFAVASQHHFAPVSKSIILDDKFDWEGDVGVIIHPRDLIIYEAHIKDMTAHKSSESTVIGDYNRFHDFNQEGGIVHLKEMGYNAVEFLPLFEFSNVEIPYGDTTQAVTNTWNPYAYNHWGYMPAFFFAPEGRYASDAIQSRGAWNGTKGRQVHELKALVKALHKENIAVILDVVYNHVSQYNFNPLKQIHKQQYFRQNEEGTYSSVSGCGNDLATEHPHIRELIIESVLFWMEEYHIDGFRFDLGKLIDWETVEQIREEALKVNPHVFITCEPWGGGYDPEGFSLRGWSSWNDQFRNALKGWHPDGNGGFLFGRWHPDYGFDKLQRMFMGSPNSEGGQYVDISHSVNYLESHDDYTLGDFIKIETELFSKDAVIQDKDTHALLTPVEIAMHKVAAMALLTSQGPVMIAQGQEWGRSKVIAETLNPDSNVGKMDHNSYEKDNETNWLNWEHKNLNAELVVFYKDLIKLRKENHLFRRADPKDFNFFTSKEDVTAIGFTISKGESQVAVFLNSSSIVSHFPFSVEGWNTLLQSRDGNFQYDGKIQIPPRSGIILTK
ncbi:MAG: alpha-amylase family glycosyl hydrolase [Candidatus Marinimicrobia bacterium]|nr:alpha-amylase family glycosyl hydrolase [Candidatus Neomarinimicrobiota bacterium]MDP6853791.1 alpha-amylase family glycosyl hydrolase [Candidatus Neomarinimicrobiota bacterium]